MNQIETILYKKVIQNLIGYTCIEALSKGLNLFLFIILASILPHQEYASLSVTVAIELILVELLALGQSTYLMRIYKSSDPITYETTVYVGRKIVAAVLVFLLILIIIMPPDADGLLGGKLNKWILIVLVLAVGIQSQISINQTIWRVKSEITQYSICRATNQIAKFIIIFCLAFKTKKADVYGFGLLIANLFTLIIIKSLCPRKYSLGKVIGNKVWVSQIRENLKFSIPIALHGIIGSAYVIIDRIFLAKMSDPQSLATYSFCLNQGTSVFFIIYIISFTLMPKFYEGKSYDDQSKRFLGLFLSTSISGVILMSLIIYYIVFPISLRFVPAAYAAGQHFLPFILFGGVLVCLENYFMYKLSALRYVKQLPAVTFFSLVIRAALIWCLVPKNGVVGVLTANTVSQIVNCLALFAVSEYAQKNQYKKC